MLRTGRKFKVSGGGVLSCIKTRPTTHRRLPTLATAVASEKSAAEHSCRNGITCARTNSHYSSADAWVGLLQTCKQYPARGDTWIWGVQTSISCSAPQSTVSNRVAQHQHAAVQLVLRHNKALLVLTKVRAWSPARPARSSTAVCISSLTSGLALAATASCPDRAVARVFPAAASAAPECPLDFLAPFLALPLFFILLTLRIVVGSSSKVSGCPAAHQPSNKLIGGYVKSISVGFIHLMACTK